MNPLSGTAWLWRAIRGHSLTFSILFALGLFGLSVAGWFRHLLHGLGAPWYVWLLLPFGVIAALARKETDWMPDPDRRRRWSRGIVVGSILLFLVVAKLAPKPAIEPVRMDRAIRPGR